MKKKSGKTITKEKDLEWKKKIKERDKYTCQKCDKKLTGINCQAHHIIPKTFREFRWEEMNGITLCWYCHEIGKFSAHKNAIHFSEWLKENRKQSQFLFSDFPTNFKFLLTDF